MTIRINSENLNRKKRIDLLKTDRVAKAVLKALEKDNVELNIVFLSNQKIRALNRAYLGRDKATDVIAFPAGKGPGSRVTGHGPRFLGDIAISSDKAAENSGAYGLTLMEEAALYVIHGILHLLGYDDTTKKARDAMRRKEDGLLQKVRNYL